MAIKVECPACGKRLSAPDSAAGKRAKCPTCGAVVVVPEPVYDAEEVSEDQGLEEKPAPLPPSGVGDLLDEADEYALAPTLPPPAAPRPAARTPSGAGDGRRPCPMCGEMIPVGAGVCRFCGEVFDASLKKRRKKKRRGGGAEDEDLTGVDIMLAILCTNIACIMGIIWMIQGKPKGGKMIGLCVLINVIAFFVGMVMGFLGEAP